MIRFFDKDIRRLNKLSRIKLIASDLDGTLLDSNNEISEPIKKNIAQLSELGVRFLLASGRTHEFMKRYALELSLATPIISLNGGIAKRLNDKNALYCASMPEVVAEMTQEFCKENPLTGMSAFTPTGTYVTNPEILIPKYLRSEITAPEVIDDLSGVQDNAALYIAYGPYAEIQQLSVLLAQKFKSSLRRVSYTSKTNPDYMYLEIQRMDANKGSALAYICKDKKIPKSSVAAIGDYANDIDMLKFAGVSASMNNALDEIKNYTDYVMSKSNDEDGSMEFFEIIIDAKQQVNS